MFIEETEYFAPSDRQFGRREQSMAVKGVNVPTIMSTSAPQYSYANRESRANNEDGDLEDIIEQIKMACRPASEPKEERESDYDTDIEDLGKKKKSGTVCITKILSLCQ